MLMPNRWEQYNDEKPKIMLKIESSFDAFRFVKSLKFY